MEGIKYIKIAISISFILLVISFFMSCQSPLFQTPYNAENDLLTNSKYYGLYISKNDVSINAANEKLNVLITNDNGISIYMWIGSSSFPSEDKDRFDISNSAIDGEFPHYAFNNNEVVGKFSIINQNVINISFATLFQPYLNIQNVACNKYVTTAKN